MTSFGKVFFGRRFGELITLFVFVLLYFFVISNKEILIVHLHRANWILIALSGLAHLLAMLMQTLGWYFLVTQISENKSFVAHSSIYALSLLARRIPLGIIWSIGGRFSKYKDYLSKNEFSLLVGYEYVLIGGAGALLIFFILLVNPYLVPTSVRYGLVVTLSLLGGVFVGSMALKRSSFIPSIIRKMAVDLSRFPFRVLMFSFMSFLITWIMDGIAFYLLVISLGINKELSIALGTAWLAAFSGFLGQFMPLNTAYKELTLTLLISRWIPISLGLFVAILQRVIHTIIEIFLAIVLDKAGHRL